MKTLFRILIPMLFLSPLSGQNNSAIYQPPKALEDGWKVSSLHKRKLDTTRLYNLLSQLKAEQHKIHSMLVVQNGELLIEEYFNGYHAAKQQDLRSATKSISSLLAGIALDKGFIQSIEDPITQYLPEKLISKKKDQLQKIKIRHLLTMSTGLDCNDWDRKSKGQEDRVYRKLNGIQYFLKLPKLHDPGTVSNYCTMSQVLLMEIISHAAKQDIRQFAKQYLFEPLGIANYGWDHTALRKMPPAFGRLQMTPRDLAKIGQLLLNKGQWEEQQIISSSWLSNSTSPKTQINKMDYGFLWWKIPMQVDTIKLEMTAATGNGGQYLFIIPEERLVVVFTGGAYNSPNAKFPFIMLKKAILPIFLEHE